MKAEKTGIYARGTTIASALAMRNLLLFLIASVAAAADVPQFSGTWEGRFAGRVFCVLTLDAPDGRSGAISPGTIELDDEGALIDAQPAESGSSHPIENVQIEGPRLRFEARDSEDDLLRFELRVVNGESAELRIIGLPIKPIPMARRPR